MNILVIPTFILLVLCCSFEFSVVHKTSICKKTGYICKSCTQTMLCINNGTGFVEAPIQSCDRSFTCLDGACTTLPNHKCNNDTKVEPQFVCHAPGLYPDPYDCTKYYFCLLTEGKKDQFEMSTETCNPGYSYNMKSGMCDIQMIHNSHACDESYPLATCKVLGKTDKFKHDPMYYYVCQEHPHHPNLLYPFIYVCENGKTYNPSKYSCI